MKLPYWYYISRVTKFRDSQNFSEETRFACIKFRDYQFPEIFACIKFRDSLNWVFSKSGNKERK